MVSKPSPYVKLPNDLVASCGVYAIEAIYRYAQGRNEASRKYSYRNADRRVGVWHQAKMAECVCAIENGRLPQDLNWSHEPDHFDLVLHGKRVDVKAVPWYANFLIWSIAKNGIFNDKRFDILMLVKMRHHEGRTVGWVTKQEFAEQHHVAGPGHKLDVGTWYMDETELHPMTELPT